MTLTQIQCDTKYNVLSFVIFISANIYDKHIRIYNIL